MMSKELKIIMSQSEKGIELVLTKTKVLMRLDEDALKEATNDIEKEMDGAPTGWLGKMKNFLLSNVQKLINKRIEYGLDEIDELRFEDGELKFTYATEHMISFESIHVGDSKTKEEIPALRSFDPEDAKAFVESFNEARQQYLEFLED